jgi:hypothetical protein
VVIGIRRPLSAVFESRLVCRWVDDCSNKMGGL